MADTRKLKDKALELVAKGKFEKAAEVYREIVEADPKDLTAKQHLAEALRKAGDKPAAIRVYGEVADRYGRDGLLIKAIAICKIILEIDPAHGDTQAALATLYAKKRGGEAPPTRAASAIRGASVGIPRPKDGAAPSLDPAVPAVPATAHPPAPEPEPLVLTRPTAPAGGQAAAPAKPPPPPAIVEEPSGPHFLVSGATPFEQILSVANAATEAGVDDQVEIDVGPSDDEEVFSLSTEDEPLSPPPGPAPRPQIEELDLGETLDAAFTASAPQAPQQPSPPPPERPLPTIPLFSDLSHEAFVELAQRMSFHRAEKDQVIVREGDAGDSFYVIASGKVRVEKKDEATDEVIPLAHLGEGAFFGEMAMLSGAPRAATITADAPTELLEITSAVLKDLCGRFPHVADSLKKFYRQRLLANAMATSPLFRPFDREDKKQVIERFKSREVKLGEVIVEEGKPADGLYVILAGSVDVKKKKDGGEVLAGRLHEGDVFGEVSCLSKGPASATVVMRRGGTLLRLPRAAFDELIVTYPQILMLVSELSDERVHNLEAIVSGQAEFTEEGLILT